MKRTGKRCAVAIFVLLLAMSTLTALTAFAQDGATAAVEYVTHGNPVTVEAVQGGYHVTGSVSSNSKFAYNRRVNTKVGFGVDVTYNFDLSAGDHTTRRLWFFINKAERDTDGNVTDSALQLGNGIQVLIGSNTDWSGWNGLNVGVYANGTKQTYGGDDYLHTKGAATSESVPNQSDQKSAGAWLAWALHQGKTVRFTFKTVGEGTWHNIVLGYTHEDGTTYEVEYGMAHDKLGASFDGDVVFGIMQENGGGIAAATLDYTVGKLQNAGITLDKSTLTMVKDGQETVTATATLPNKSDTPPTVTWSSSNTDVATVDGGVITAVGSGNATISAVMSHSSLPTATADNGMIATASVIVGDLPTISVSGVPTGGVQYAKIGLPSPQVDTGVLGSTADYDLSVAVTGAETHTLTAEPFEFTPETPGAYKVRYAAVFDGGLKIETQEYALNVTRAELPILEKWETSGSENSSQDIYATQNGKGIVATGSVGGGYASTDNIRDTAKYVYNVPIDLNAVTVFDLTLDLDLENFADDAGNGDQYRSFAVVLNQSSRTQDGKTDASKLDKVLDLDSGKRGVQVAFAKAGTWGEWAEGLRWEAYDTAGAKGYNHFHTTKNSGVNSIPDLPDGDTKFSLARKISGGQTFRVKIEKKGEELHFTADNILWRFPLSEIAYTDENNIYLAFVSDNSNGTSKVNFKVENIVNGFIESVSFAGEQSERILEIDQTHELTPKIELKDGVNESDANKTVVWSTSNEKVATVEDGTVTAHKPGRAVIRATTAEGKYAEITVIVPAKSVSVDIATKTVKVGKGFRLTAAADPEDTEITFESSNEAVATVNANGDVLGVSAGTATIYAYAGDKRAECVVTVEDYTLESLTFEHENYSFAVGEKEQLTVTASDGDVPLAWSVSDESVADITGAGFICGKAAGTVTVTVTGGGKTATCTVTFVQSVPKDGEGCGCGSAANGTLVFSGALLICAAAVVALNKFLKSKGEKQ